jgi:hypothetical protein
MDFGAAGPVTCSGEVRRCPRKSAANAATSPYWWCGLPGIGGGQTTQKYSAVHADSGSACQDQTLKTGPTSKHGVVCERTSQMRNIKIPLNLINIYRKTLLAKQFGEEIRPSRCEAPQVPRSGNTCPFSCGSLSGTQYLCPIDGRPGRRFTLVGAV